MEVERFFDYMSIHEDRKVKLVANKFKGGASIWWEKLQISRARQGKGPVTSSLKMKQCYSKHGFYHRTLSNNYSNNTKSVDKEVEPSRRMLRISIAYLPGMISWRQKINKLQGLLVDCVWQYKIRFLYILSLLSLR
jgi:hypothetical protein